MKHVINSVILVFFSFSKASCVDSRGFASDCFNSLSVKHSII
jgi:hypothetical protein